MKMKSTELSKDSLPKIKLVNVHQTIINIRDGFARDPIHQNADKKWYFWDETWVGEHGPFETKEKAEEELDKHCQWLLKTISEINC